MKPEQINKLEGYCKQYKVYKMSIKTGKIDIISETNYFTSIFLSKVIDLKLEFVIKDETLTIFECIN